MITSLDKNDYNEADLVTIKVPLSLPYLTNWSDFERYDGSIEVDGQHYNYVKRKVSNDTLILLCIPNKNKTLLTNAKNAYENLVNTTQPSTNGNKTGTAPAPLKLLLSVYNEHINTYTLVSAANQLPAYIIANNNQRCWYTIPSPWQPPDTAC